MAPACPRDRCFVVVAFDVRDDRRRTRLGRHLLRHGTRVQLSVFECLVRHHRIEAFMRELMRFLDPTVDRLTVYPLCHPCQDGVHRRGAPLGALPEPEAFIV